MSEEVRQNWFRKFVIADDVVAVRGALCRGLHETVKAGNLAVYPDEAIRLAVSRAIAVESSRGWRIDKAKQSHKIDVVVALAMAALACVRAETAPKPRLRMFTLSDGYPTVAGIELDPSSGRRIEADPYRNPLSAVHNGCRPGKGLDQELMLFNAQRGFLSQ